ncbi:hypothetical protein LOAG_06511 [Loa loa]|uniref:Uncharacterized protein n=1 Tax=Loa loa TaxID=7209 RepID=A0A1I7V7X8_LOALO|nr:hypothetical protein LOAG_06511 [Loa loa]EFO21974.1 hypothetical protein LOAG_06511 [Loa loa]
MLEINPDLQTPLESTNPPTAGDNKDIKKAAPTLDFETVGSDKIGQEQKLGIQEWINLTLDRECTPTLYVYFACIAILGVITIGIIIIVGLQCSWNFITVG